MLKHSSKGTEMIPDISMPVIKWELQVYLMDEREREGERERGRRCGCAGGECGGLWTRSRN